MLVNEEMNRTQRLGFKARGQRTRRDRPLCQAWPVPWTFLVSLAITLQGVTSFPFADENKRQKEVKALAQGPTGNSGAAGMHSLGLAPSLSYHRKASLFLSPACPRAEAGLPLIFQESHSSLAAKDHDCGPLRTERRPWSPPLVPLIPSSPAPTHAEAVPSPQLRFLLHPLPRLLASCSEPCVRLPYHLTPT